jgi:hypothetical protein
MAACAEEVDTSESVCGRYMRPPLSPAGPVTVTMLPTLKRGVTKPSVSVIVLDTDSRVPTV